MGVSTNTIMEPSSYELSRLENIKRNNEILLGLGLIDAAKACAVPKLVKAKPPPKPKPETVDGPSRRSARGMGLPAEVDDSAPGVDEASERWQAPAAVERDGRACWWLPPTEEQPEAVRRPALTTAQLFALQEPLSREERESLVLEGDGDAWVTDMLTFSRAYGGQQPEPFCVPSRANFKKFFDTASVLASGEGVRCNYRGGVFDAGINYTPRHDLDEALSRALKWLPKAKDKSNGWVFTHPFEKMKQYQRYALATCRHIRSTHDLRYPNPRPHPHPHIHPHPILILVRIPIPSHLISTTTNNPIPIPSHPHTNCPPHPCPPPAELSTGGISSHSFGPTRSPPATRKLPQPRRSPPLAIPQMRLCGDRWRALALPSPSQIPHRPHLWISHQRIPHRQIPHHPIPHRQIPRPQIPQSLRILRIRKTTCR